MNQDLDERRRERALELAAKAFPQGAGSVENLISAAKKIESYLKGDES